MSTLTNDQVALQLENLPNWVLDGNVLTRTFTFNDFASAVSFIVRASFAAQALEHYPVWMQDYNTVTVRIGAADQHSVEGRDVQLAKRLEAASQAL